MTGVLIRNIRGKDTDTEEMRRLCEDGGRDRSDAATNPECLEPLETGKARNGSLPRVWMERCLADSLISGFQPPDL